jgi:hypothetical protein
MIVAYSPACYTRPGEFQKEQNPYVWLRLHNTGVENMKP